MRHRCIRVIVLLIACLAGSMWSQAEATMYISEMIEDSTAEDKEYKMLVTVLQEDGTKRREIVFDGRLIRISPDQKYFLYVELYEDPKNLWDIALADAHGKKVKVLPVVKNKPGKQVEEMLWAPDQSKIAVLLSTPKTYSNDFKNVKQVYILVVFDLNNEKILHVHHETCVPARDECLYGITWLQDSTRLLLHGNTGLHIINVEHKSSIALAHEPARAYVTGSANHILVIAGEPATRTAATVRTYDLIHATWVEILRLEFFPVHVLPSHDGQAVLFQDDDRLLWLLDVAGKSLAFVDTGNMILWPLAFAPQDNRRVAGLGASQDDGNYGIFDLHTRQYHPLIDVAAASPQGEASMAALLLLRIDWLSE